jgi:asparagine synthase (glutamine-hydrolysing)
LFAAEVVAGHGGSWHRLDIDTDELIPEHYGGFVSEPQAILYAYQFALIEDCMTRTRADILLTGALGDVIFEFGGIAPAFLADPLAAGSPLGAIKLARRWAAARGNTRTWSHFLRHVALPIAWRHRRGLSVLDWQSNVAPSWMTSSARRRCGAEDHQQPQRAPRVAEPGRQHLWESVYDLAAHENGPFYRRLSADVRHPLYHRPLVEFLLGLDFTVRRGFEDDRRLQRRALADRLPEAVLTRRSKGSAQELRERHLMESRRWYHAMTVEPRIVQRGWVDPRQWREQVDRTRVGASDLSARFVNAVQAELWLRALERVPMPSPVSLTV